MSDTLRNVIGALAFAAAAIFFISYVGNMTSNTNRTATAPKIQKAEEVDIKQAPTAPADAKKAVVKAEARVVDANKGFSSFKRKCMGCHTINKGAPNRTGPNLWGIVDRAKGDVDGYRYSRNLKALGGVWTEADLSSFIAGPRVMVPDTKMTTRGLKTEADRLDIIAFLKTLKD